MHRDLHDAIATVCEAAEDARMRIVLVGALASALAAEEESGCPAFRATNDSDFAVPVRNWEAYRALRDALTRAFTRDPQIEHRLHRGPAVVDLIPYGRHIAPSGTLTWPESGFEMTVVGFDEACSAAPRAAGNLPVPVITVPGFVLLKIVAFLDRQGRHDPKHGDDARDIAFWLRHFASGSQDARRFDLGHVIGPAHDDYDTAGAVLLGMDVGTLASVEAGGYVARLFECSVDPCSAFADALARGQFPETAESTRLQAVRLLAAFEKGYRHARA